MKKRYLRTSDLAREIGIHPNTVRQYEAWGFLPPIPRSPKGYRRFTKVHLEQMRLAYMALKWPYPGGSRELVAGMVRRAAGGDLGGALEDAYTYLARIHAEQAQAEAAAEYLERWARGAVVDAVGKPLLIGQVARRLGVTKDALRNWERNGLIQTPRDPQTGYRLYGGRELGRLRVIRTLRQAGYSLMALLRMLTFFDRYGAEEVDLRLILDTPRPDENPDTEEDLIHVTDRWLTTLAAQETRARALIDQLERMLSASADL